MEDTQFNVGQYESITYISIKEIQCDCADLRLRILDIGVCHF